MLLAKRAPLKRRLPRILTRQETVALLRRAGRRDRALLAFLLDTGARLSEAAGVRRSDIQLHTDDRGQQKYVVRLRGSEDSRGHWRLKTGERLVPLGTTAARMLTGVGAGDVLWTSAVDGRPLSICGVQQVVLRCTQRALGRRCGPHVLRHTFATMYLRAGGDIHRLQRILGHSKIETTLIYLHLVTDDLTSVHDSLTPLAGLAQ